MPVSCLVLCPSPVICLSCLSWDKNSLVGGRFSFLAGMTDVICFSFFHLLLLVLCHGIYSFVLIFALVGWLDVSVFASFLPCFCSFVLWMVLLFCFICYLSVNPTCLTYLTLFYSMYFPRVQLSVLHATSFHLSLHKHCIETFPSQTAMESESRLGDVFSFNISKLITRRL